MAPMETVNIAGCAGAAAVDVGILDTVGGAERVGSAERVGMAERVGIALGVNAVVLSRGCGSEEGGMLGVDALKPASGLAVAVVVSRG